MQDSKFITLLRTLRDDELSAFYKHLKQQHKPDHIPLRVFDYLYPFYPEFRDEKKLNTEFAYKKIFGEPMDLNPRNRFRLLNALSDLHLSLKNFLISQKAIHGKFESRYLWLSVLEARGLNTEFERSMTELNEEMNRSLPNGGIGFMQNMIINYFFNYHPVLKKSNLVAEHLEQCNQDLDILYRFFKTLLACEMVNCNQVYAANFKPEEFMDTLHLSAGTSTVNPPVMQLFREAYSLLSTGQNDHYERIENLLHKHASEIAIDELHSIISYMNNYAARKIRSGQMEFCKKLHELNKL
jgi:hypothetical protein